MTGGRHGKAAHHQGKAGGTDKKTAGATAGIIRPLRPQHGESTGMGDHFIGDSLIFL